MDLFGRKNQEAVPDKIRDIILAGDRNEAWAQNARRKMFDAGMSDEQHNKMRIAVYTPLAKNGDTFAQKMLGLLSSTPSESLFWYSLAAEQGDTEAMMYLSRGYSDYAHQLGYGLAYGVDKQKELAWMRKAARAGDSEAQCAIAQEYAIGNLVKCNSALEYAWYRKAAEQNYPRGIFNVARLLNRRFMAEPFYDPNKAEELFLKVTEMFDTSCRADAAMELGYIYGAAYLIDGLMPNKKTNARKALYWFFQAILLDKRGAAEDFDTVLNKSGETITRNDLDNWRQTKLKYDNSSSSC